MPEGTVKFFNRAKGFGFIVPDDGDKEVFLPPAAVTGIAALSPGQRVSFEIVADPKGPKAASLKVLEGVVPVAPRPQPAPRPQVHPQPPHAAPPPVAVSLFCDPSTQAAQDVMAALQAQKQHAHVVDITATPLTVPQLRKWSQALAGTGQPLVRRSMPLFFDLQLDDRFLHEDEFWTAVLQHPVLLTGPILSVRERVRICRTPEDVKAFFAASADTDGDHDAAPKSKNISSRLMAMMRGEAVGPRPPAPPPVADEPVRVSVKAAPAPKTVTKAPLAARPKAAPAKAKPAAKVEKPKPAARKAVAKPAAKKAVAKAKPVKKKK